MSELIRYDAACRAIAEATAIDELLSIHDLAQQAQAAARVAKNFEMEANAVEIRMRATRRLDQLRQAQKEVVGLATGGEHGGRARIDGLRANPSIVRPTLKMQGIDKALAHQGRVLGRMDESAFERKIVEARSSASKVFRRAVREAEIEQERAEHRARAATGGSVADLYALIKSGYRAGCISIDPPWRFKTHSARASHMAADHYETMPLDEIKALPMAQLAAPDCALFLWVTWPFMPVWHEVIKAWDFDFSGLGFDLIKLNPSGEGLHMGGGYGTRANPEPCLLARRGEPLRLDGGVHSVIMAPVGEHSEKPDEAYRRMERLFGGPYLELFARQPREGWTTWGDEVPPPLARRP